MRVKRKSFADLTGIPPYAVFHDSALAQMAQKLPTTREAFLRVSGVGTAKLEKYGEAFIEIIKNYLEENPDKNPLPELPVKARSSLGVARHQEVGNLYQAGTSIAELMAKYDVKLQTILEHLYKYVSEGNALRIDHQLTELSQLPDDVKKQVFSAFDQWGTLTLSSTFESLGKNVSYEDLKVLRLCYLRKDIR